MGHAKQTSFFKTNGQHSLTHGGSLRRVRAGRGVRPLSTKEPLHVVFKVRRERLRHGGLRHGVTYTRIQQIVRRYAKKFFVKVEQITIQGDHCHLLIRAPRRAKFHAFFRVVSGQIAQKLQLEGLLNPGVTDTPTGPRADSELRKKDELRAGSETASKVRGSSEKSTRKMNAKGTQLWKYRPFSRVVRGWRAYKIVCDYIKLNELEAQGRIPYRKSRLRGMSSTDWEVLWA
jgi:REP element-mobilizing transposase RayT